MVPAFGYNKHVSTDRRHRLIRKWAVTHAAANDGRQLPGLIDPDNTASPLWTDTAYRPDSNQNRHGEPRLQHAPVRPARREPRARMAPSSRKTGPAAPKTYEMTPQSEAFLALNAQNKPSRRQ